MSKVTAERIKQIISQESPELVAALMSSMAEHIERQQELILRLEAEQLKKSQSSFLIEENIKLLRRKLFGRSKEDRVEASDRPRDKSQTEALIFSQAMFPTREDRDQKKDRWSGLKMITIDHELSDAELVAESVLRGLTEPCREQWEELKNVVDTVTVIQVIERSYVKELHRKKKYKLKSKYSGDEKEVIITAKGPESLLAGMNYSTDFVTSVVADKYISHMPLERQTREMESLGLKGIKNSTLSRFCALAAASLEGLQEDILAELRLTDLALHIDETPWKVQNKAEKDGYLWVISNRSGSYYFLNQRVRRK